MKQDERDESFFLAERTLVNGDPASALKILEDLRYSLKPSNDGSNTTSFFEYDYYVIRVLSCMASIANDNFFQHKKAYDYLLEAEEVFKKLFRFEWNNKNKFEGLDYNIIYYWLNIQGNLGFTEFRLGEIEQAKLRLEKAEETCKCYHKKYSDIFYDLLNFILFSQGVIYSHDGSYTKANAYLSEALELCNLILNARLKNSYEYESVSVQRVEILNLLSRISIENKQTKEANIYGKELEKSTNELSIKYPLVDIFMQLRDVQCRCDIYLSQRNISEAINIKTRLEYLINKANLYLKNDTSKVLVFNIVAAKVSLSKIFFLSGKSTQSRDIIIQILTDIENSLFYPESLIQIIIHISQLYLTIYFSDVNPIFKPIEKLVKKLFSKKLSIEINEIFNRISMLLLKWHEFQSVEIPESVSESLHEFWHIWVEVALYKYEVSLLTNILTTHHARRQIAMLNLNWITANNLDSDIQHFVDLKKNLHELELQLLPFQQSLTVETTLRYHDLVCEYETSHKLCQKSRDALIATGRYPDWTKSRTDLAKLQASLNSGEAILLTMSFEDLGFPNKAPVLLLLRQDSIDWIDSPEIAAAAQTMLIIHKLQTTQGRNLPLRKNTTEYNNHDIAKSSSEMLSAKFNQLQKEMQSFWQAKSLCSKLANITHLTIIGHGTLQALPFQNDCPVKKNACYPSMHVFWQRKSKRHAPIPMPSDDIPLFILANAAENDPVNRLYYLPVEIEAITQIWGIPTIRVIDDLKDFESGHLLFLGHGSFDKKSSQARFMMKHRELEAHELLTLKKNILTLGASACLLGQAIDIADAEPMGLFALAGNRNDIRFNYGAILPVDDLKCCFLSCLFHFYWKKTGAPHEGMRLALYALKTREWDSEAQEIFIRVLAKQLPAIFVAMRDDEMKQPSISEHLDEFYYSPWLENRRSNIDLRTTMIDDKNDDRVRQTAAAELVKDFFSRRMSQVNEFSVDFAPYWIYG